MVQMVILITLFFIPVLSLYMICKNDKKPLRPDLKLFSQYCIIAVLTIPFAKMLIFLVGKVTGVSIAIEFGYYILAALISAFLLYLICWVYTLFIEYPNKLSYFKSIPKQFLLRIKQRKLRGIVKELAPAYILVFVALFMLFVFEPILMYSTNINDFWFDFSIMIGPVLQIFLFLLMFGIAIFSVIYFLNLLFSSKLIFYKGVILAGAFLFFMLYIQGNWLAGNLPILRGEEIAWENYGKTENLILFSAMALLIVVIVFSVVILKLNRTIRYAIASVSIVFVMLSVSLVSTVIANDAIQNKNTFSPTIGNFNTISTDKNFLIFLLDTVESKTCYDIIREDEDFSDILDDFTFYPDTLGIFTHTRDSIPAILTGKANYNRTDYKTYCNEAYNSSPLFNKLKLNGYSINLYSPSVFWGRGRNYEIDNSISIYDIEIDVKEFGKEELKYISFKYLPYMFKKYSKIETFNFDKYRNDSFACQLYGWWNRGICNYIRQNNTLEKVDNKYFHFIHCEGAHAPYYLNKDLQVIDNGTYQQQVAASLTILKTYLQRLKSNEVYDNSVIVIMADHGSIDIYPHDTPKDYLSVCNPILFVKGINEKHKLLTSNIPVSYFDLQKAFSDLIDGKQSTELFKEIEMDRTRIVLWDLWGAENHKVEYATTGHARDIDAFFPTGNVYDLGTAS